VSAPPESKASTDPLVRAVRLPLSAEMLDRDALEGRPMSVDFRFGVVGRDPAPHYPGERPDSSVLIVDGRVLPLVPSTLGNGWAVVDGASASDLDDWLSLRGLPRLDERLAIVAYGSNANPQEVENFSCGGAVVSLAGTLFGAGAAYCSSTRTDGQYPAGLARTDPSRGERHSLLLIDPDSQAALDRKEGAGSGFYERCFIETGSGIDFVLDDGSAWRGGLPAYLQGERRRLASVGSRPVLVSEVTQADLGLRVLEGAGAGFAPDAVACSSLPRLNTAPVPVFAYGTLQPGESRWGAIKDLVASTGKDRVTGRKVDTGFGFPGLVQDPGAFAGGTLLYPKAESYRHLLVQLDRIEGHPDLFTRQLHRLASGTLAWVYGWNGPMPE